MATTKEIRISQLPLEKDIRGMMTVGVNSANQSVRVPLGEVINEEISKVKRTYNYSRIDALTVESSADDVATALIAENENKRTMPNVGDVLVDWGGVTRVPVVRQTVQTGGEKPIYSFSFRTADNTATKTVKIQGYLYEPQTVVSVETVKDVTQQQISTLDTQLAEEATARLNQDDVLEAKITEEKNARIAKDDVVFTVTKDTINDAETVGDANWAWALIPSVSDEELNARIAKRANFYVDVSLDTLGFLPYLKFIKLESIPENKDGVFSALIPPASEFGYVETTNIKVKYNAKHKRWIALFYGADYIIPTVTSKKNGLMSKSDKAKLDALPTQLTAEQTARTNADAVLQTDINKRKPIVLKLIIGDDGNTVNSAKPLDLGLASKPFGVSDMEPFDIATIEQALIDKTPIVLDTRSAFGDGMSDLLTCIEARIDAGDAWLFFQMDLMYFIADIIVVAKEDLTTHEILYQCHIYNLQSRLADVENSFDADGQPASGLMSAKDKNLLDSLPKKITDEATARTEADKVLTANLAKEVADRTNAVNTEATAREQADTAINGEIQGIKDKGTLHDLFLASGATYNQDTKMYQLNGLDLTFNEMLTTYKYTAYFGQMASWYALFAGTKIRTNCQINSPSPGWSIFPSAIECFARCPLLENVNLLTSNKTPSFIRNAKSMFDGAPKLKKVIGINLRSSTDNQKMFQNCKSLETVQINGLNKNLEFKQSPKLTKESLVYLINHATPSSPITITLHPTAYAMATADQEIQAELEKQPNISLAEGEPSA